MKKKLTIPTILGILFLVVGVVTGVVLLSSRQIFRIGASSDAAPKDVRVSNIDDTGFTVSWVTDKEVAGYVLWGTTQSNTTNIENSIFFIN